MKPPPFKYLAPRTLDEALAYMAEHGYDAKPLAGGQSLVPAMNFRLAAPAVLVDLNRVEELFYIRPGDDGGLRIGAMTRQARLERDALIAERAPLIKETMPYVAHPQIRNRGTYGGSLAHADPAAELPAVTIALGGRLRVQSQRGERWVPAEEFFVGLFTTVLEPDELLVEIALPPLPPRTGWAFTEVSRRHGDFALVGAAAVVTLDEAGKCADVRLVYTGVGEGPVVAREAMALLRGEEPTEEAIREAAHKAAQVDVSPIGDIHASADFRRHLANVLGRRALTQAVARARG